MPERSGIGAYGKGLFVMKFGPVALEEALGKVLAHNILDAEGHRILTKGHVLLLSDLDILRRLTYQTVTVAALAPTDLGENEAARRVGNALAGSGIRVQAPGVGRANLIAEVSGPLDIDVAALNHINSIDEGITVATLREHSLVQAGQLVTLVKIIPFGVSASSVADIETTARQHAPILSVRPLQARSTALILSAPESGRERVLADFTEPTRARMVRLGSALDSVIYVPHQIEAMADAICAEHRAGRYLVILAGISAIMDQHDIAPEAVRAAGGAVSHFGVPVDPGSLLMLGYLDNMPILGAPGCLRSMQTNVMDMILPRLLAGERLTRYDLAMMGHGGLLDDISERPMPRS